MPNDPEQNQDKLIEAKANLIQKYLEYSKNPKPSYLIDGQQVEWGDYSKMLRAEIAALGVLIADEGGDWEELSQYVV